MLINIFIVDRFQRGNKQTNKQRFTAEEVSAIVLTKAKEIAEAYLKTTVTKAVITVPRGSDQRSATHNIWPQKMLDVLPV